MIGLALHSHKSCHQVVKIVTAVMTRGPLSETVDDKVTTLIIRAVVRALTLTLTCQTVNTNSRLGTRHVAVGRNVFHDSRDGGFMAVARCRCCERRQPVRAPGPRRHERSPPYKIIHCVYTHIFDASAIPGATLRVAHRPSSCVPLNAPQATTLEPVCLPLPPTPAAVYSVTRSLNRVMCPAMRDRSMEACTRFRDRHTTPAGKRGFVRQRNTRVNRFMDSRFDRP